MKRRIQDPRIAQKVMEMVAAQYKTTPDMLKSEEGDHQARQLFMYIMKQELGGTLRATREYINLKANASVYQACKTIKALFATDTTLKTRIEEIKAEALMIASIPGGMSGGTPASIVVSSGPRERRTSEDGVVPIFPLGGTAHVISRVQTAVTGVFLGSNLLQSSDPAMEVSLAKDAALFLIWNDFPKQPLTEVLNSFHIADQNDFYRAIGRITVCLNEQGGLKKKLKAARAAYRPA